MSMELAEMPVDYQTRASKASERGNFWTGLISKGNYLGVGEIRLVGTPFTDSNRRAYRDPSIFSSINRLVHNIRINSSAVAFDNAVQLLGKVYFSEFRIKTTENLENHEGIFVDVTRGDLYYAFELYNGGEIIAVRKEGMNNSNVTEYQSVDDITL